MKKSELVEELKSIKRILANIMTGSGYTPRNRIGGLQNRVEGIIAKINKDGVDE